MKEILRTKLLLKAVFWVLLVFSVAVGRTNSLTDVDYLPTFNPVSFTKQANNFEDLNYSTAALNVLTLNDALPKAFALDSPKTDTSNSPYQINDNLNPFSKPKNPFDFGNPYNITRSIEYDPVSRRYVLRETVGGRLVRPPTYMTFEEYMDYESKNAKKEYFEKKSNSAAEAMGETSRDGEGGLIPKIFVGPKIFDKIFGGNFVDIRPQGSAELRFAGNFITNENPALNIQQRRIGNFDFNMDIQMNVVGNIGEKLKFTANQNTQAVFNFENQMKLDYTGYEDEIIKKIEAGNVTLPLRSSLIQGSQSLFGIKTELQFGRLRITTVLSQQQGNAQNIQVQNGAQTTSFDIGVEQYDANRHYFLTQFFRNNFNNAMSALPIIRSNIQITRVEVWVTNRNNVSAEVRDICGFMDLAEPQPHNNTIPRNPNKIFPENDANELFNQLVEVTRITDSLRNGNLVLDVLESRFPNLRNTTDYEKVFARKLQPTEFFFHPQLGYISLNQTLNNDEVLAVAFEYTLNGIPYKVGEFSQDLPNDQMRPQVIMLKLLKSTALRVDLPTWDLMMKNIYSLNAFQVSNKDFMLNIAYQDLANGYMNFVPEGSLAGKQLIQVLGLDNLNVQLEPQPDGFFDYIENVTINSQNGKIIFPRLEPFGSDLRTAFLAFGGADMDTNIIEKYVFEELYDSTRAWAIQFPEKNRFRIRGRYQSSSGSEINLGAFNLPPGSVRVTAGSRQLAEGSDYRVDYNMGKVQILNTSLLNSAEPINVSFENNPMFQINQRTLTATRFDYLASKKLNLGGTFMHLNERPITQKVNLGEEPISNSIVGVDFNYRSDSRFITRMVDKLPFLSTKEISSITLNGEFAQLIPGSSKAIRGEENGVSYIDDFEGTENAVDIRLFGAWSLSSVPTRFPESNLRNNLRSGFNRALLSWYTIDPLFFRQSNITPDHIKNDVEMRSNHYMREILEQEVFPNRQLANNQPLNIPTLDLAYFPQERGAYNYESAPTETSAGVNENGFLNNPRSRWGGIQRKIETNDFEAANIEFIEFWMLDPYIYNPNHSGGDMFINLGSVSEDVLKDGRRTFENGFPRNSGVAEVDTTAWGLVPRLQPIVNAFDNDPAARAFQDVGLDGFNDENERIFFEDSAGFLTSIRNLHGENSAAYQKAFNDPSSDNYHHFRGSDYDAAQLDILQRYKRFANYEGNSPVGNSVEPFPTQATNLPNTEDINFDNTLNQNEDYYEYRISLRPEDMVIGRNNINDIYEAPVRLRNGREERVKWYQFRVPVMKPDLAVGNVIDFKTIRFMRMFLTNFSDSVVLRFASMQLVRTDWRKYIQSLAEPGEYQPIDNDETTVFTISTVNIEENGNRSPIPYVVPPGILRQQNLFTTNFQQLNEQSLQLRFCGLRDGDSRAAFKNTTIDIRAYRRLRMFIHAEGNELENGDVNAFMRLGNDFTQNFYEYELPLTVTRPGIGDPRGVWPLENEIDITFKEIIRAKQLRDQSNWPLNAPFVVFTSLGHKITVVGNPLLNNLRILMVGVRNPKREGVESGDDGLDKCGEVWFNELRMTDFDNSGGWAATGLATIKMADFGTLNVSGTRRTIGWGSIESKPLERNREDAQMFDFSGTFELGKFFPQKVGLNLPMFIGYSQAVSTPEYNPLQPDILLQELLEIQDDGLRRDSILRTSQTLDRRRSINFTNVSKSRSGKTKKPKLWDIENLSATFAYSQIFQRNPFTEINNQEQYRGSLAYNYSTQAKFLKPFSWLGKNKILMPITDFNFNLIPSSLTLRADVDRVYQILQLRNNAEGGISIPATYNKNFTINRFYNIRHDLTRSIKIEYDAINYGRVDEPFGALDTEEKIDSVRQNFWNGGRNTKFTQNFNVNYNLPFNKVKLLDFMNGSLRHGGSYDWIAAPLAADSLGNIISNTQTRQINGQINFLALYNKVDFLKRVNNNQPSKREEERKKAGDAERKAKTKTEVERNQFGEVINKKDIIVDEDKPRYVNNIARTMLKGVMMLKNIGITYSENLNTVVPGFKPSSQFLGNNFDINEPGLDFTFGAQRDLRERLIRNSLISSDTNLNQPYVTARSVNLNLRAQVEPFQDFKIELNVTKTQTERMQDFIKATADGEVRSLSMVETGDYSISIISWRTAFEKINNDPESGDYLQSQNFRNFENNRFTIANLLAAQNPNSVGVGLVDSVFPDGYSRKSPDVLIPAFFTAYTGGKVSANSLSPFPVLPLPNWRITYNGLTKLPFFKKYFQTITFNHAYRSTYTVSNFVTNLFYQERDGAPSQRDSIRSGDFIPKYQISMVTINEQLVPLLGIDATLKNSMTLRLEFKQTRSVSLSVINNRMTDMRTEEITIGLGYRLSNAKIPFLYNGKALPNDLNIRFDFNIRDNQTLIRDIDGRDPLPSGGMRMLSIKPSIDYVVNDKVNIRFFFDRLVNKPYISNAFPTANSNGGISIRFTLAR